MTSVTDVVLDKVLSIFNAAYLEGFVDVELFSIQLGRAMVSLSSSGLHVETRAELLAGLETAFDIGRRGTAPNTRRVAPWTPGK